MVCLSELFLQSATHLVFGPRTKLAATWRVGLERLSFAGCLRLREYRLKRLSFRLPVDFHFTVFDDMRLVSPVECTCNTLIVTRRVSPFVSSLGFDLAAGALLTMDSFRSPRRGFPPYSNRSGAEAPSEMVTVEPGTRRGTCFSCSVSYPGWCCDCSGDCQLAPFELGTFSSAQRGAARLRSRHDAVCPRCSGFPKPPRSLT